MLLPCLVNSMIKYIFLDLDGTITQSEFGILASAKYALTRFGIEENDPERQRKFLGPPLTVSFRELYGLSEEDIPKAIKLYREHYVGGAYKDAPLYEGIEETLRKLKEDGKILYIVTSKPKYIAEKVAEHFQLERFITEVIGPVEEKQKAGKEDLIEEAAKRVIDLLNDSSDESAEDTDGKGLPLSDIYKDTVMIGDRCYDIEAAKKLGVTSIGALYGYGTREELEEAGADYIAETPADIYTILA